MANFLSHKYYAVAVWNNFELGVINILRSVELDFLMIKKVVASVSGGFFVL